MWTGLDTYMCSYFFYYREYPQNGFKTQGDFGFIYIHVHVVFYIHNVEDCSGGVGVGAMGFVVSLELKLLVHVSL